MEKPIDYKKLEGLGKEELEKLLGHLKSQLPADEPSGGEEAPLTVGQSELTKEEGSKRRSKVFEALEHIRKKKEKEDKGGFWGSILGKRKARKEEEKQQQEQKWKQEKEEKRQEEEREWQQKREKEKQIEEEKKKNDPLNKFWREKGIDPTEFDFAYRVVDVETSNEEDIYYKDLENYHDFKEYLNGLTEEQKGEFIGIDVVNNQTGKHYTYPGVFAAGNFSDKIEKQDGELYSYGNEYRSFCRDIIKGKLPDEYQEALDRGEIGVEKAPAAVEPAPIEAKPIPEELKELKAELDKAREMCVWAEKHGKKAGLDRGEAKAKYDELFIAYGRKFYEATKSKEDIANFIFDEAAKLDEERRKKMPEWVRNIFDKIRSRYGEIPQSWKWILSASVATGVALIAAPASGIGVLSVGGYFGLRMGRAMVGTFVGRYAGTFYGKVFNNLYNIEKKFGAKKEEVRGQIGEGVGYLEGGGALAGASEALFDEMLRSSRDKLAKLAKKERWTYLGKAAGQVATIIGAAGFSSWGFGKLDSFFMAKIGGTIGGKTLVERPRSVLPSSEKAVDQTMAKYGLDKYNLKPKVILDQGGGKPPIDQSFHGLKPLPEESEAGVLVPNHDVPETVPETAKITADADAEAIKRIEELATIKKGDGIENVLIRQLEADPKGLGCPPEIIAKGEAAIHQWAGTQAHRIAIDTEYVKLDPETGQIAQETRVYYDPDNPTRYTLSRDEDGGFLIEESEGIKTYEYTPSVETAGGETTGAQPITVEEFEQDQQAGAGVPAEAVGAATADAATAVSPVTPGGVRTEVQSSNPAEVAAPIRGTAENAGDTTGSRETSAIPAEYEDIDIPQAKVSIIERAIMGRTNFAGRYQGDVNMLLDAAREKRITPDDFAHYYSIKVGAAPASQELLQNSRELFTNAMYVRSAAIMTNARQTLEAMLMRLGEVIKK